jgi:hypothetical protein
MHHHKPHLFSVFNNSALALVIISHTNNSGTAHKRLLYFIQKHNPQRGKI